MLCADGNMLGDDFDMLCGGGDMLCGGGDMLCGATVGEYRRRQVIPFGGKAIVQVLLI